MVTSAKLTKSDIDGFQYTGGWDVRWDSDVTGLGLRIYPSGKKAFILRYRHHTTSKTMVLGRFGGDMTLKQARDTAQDRLSEVRQGMDPLAERKRERHSGTFGELRTKYLDFKEIVKKRKTWREDEARLDRHIPASWKARPAKAIKPREIDELHKKIGADHPYEANRLLSLLRHMFRMAETAAWEFVPSGHKNPAADIERYPETKRKRFLTEQEMPLLARAIDRQPNVYVRAALWLYLLTGLRKAELLSAKWENIDWDRKRLRLPDTKAGEEQSVALSAQALAVLKAAPKREKNPYILPGKKKGRHLVNISKPWREVRKQAKCEDLRLHDLRRSVGSWLTQSGVDLNVIKDALRHADLSTTLIYARLGEDPAREAFEEHGKAIMKASKGPLRVVGGDIE